MGLLNSKAGFLVLNMLTLLFCFVSTAQDADIEIYGVVTDGLTPLDNVSVTILEKAKGTTTDSSGTYLINASPKDVLVFSYVGMNTIEIILEDVSTILNVELTPDIQELDEVVVTKYKRKTQTDLARTFYSDPTVINSDFGYLSPQLVGYELRVVDGKELNDKAFDILDAIAEQLPGVTIRTILGERLLFTSSVGSLRGRAAAAFEIDGNISTSTPFHVQIENVLRVGIIPSHQSIRLYGAIAGGGMVVINTNAISYGEREVDGRPYDQAKLRGNIYTEDAVSQEAMRMNEPIYLRELYHSSSKEEAISLYKKHKKNFGSSYVFVLEAYRFFQKRFGDTPMPNQIISEHQLRFDENPMALKALAYVKQSNGDLEKANELYKEVFLLRPEYGQSYLDLANSYREVKAYTKAVSLYTRYNHLIGRDLVKKDSSQFFEIFERDYSNLVALKGKEIISDKAFEQQSQTEDFQGTRLVFEWNDGEAEFALQFVNPQGHYLKEEHSLFANASEIQQEKQLGYSSKEFLMDDSLPGTWQINAKYLGNRKLTASYLKATIYYNYGLETQRKETKVFKLALKNVNQELFKINIEPLLSTK